ncbi:MAG: YIP1 family protein [Cellvibrionaceae bacterium]|nr:YIP1 family protein [Cellvibrionaceae bacterium]
MGILQHTLGILLHPNTEWQAIRNEKNSFIQVFLNHVPFLALIPAICAYVGVTQVGWVIGNGDVVRLTPVSAASLCALTYAALLAGIYLLGEFINWMSKTYGVQGDDATRHYESTALAVYVSTPILIAGFVMLYPQLWLVTAVIGLAAAYSVYLIYQGIPILMNISKEQAFMYATSVVTVGLVLLVTTLMATVVIWGMGVGPVYVN